jgi:RNA polymerase sigma-70 factor (ECF subfamily)
MRMPDDQNRELLERFVQGDASAFEALFRQFEHEVYRWILRIVRDAATAQDALVEAFWRAYRGRARFDASRSFGAWMRRIATNAALDQLKAQRRLKGTDAEYLKVQNSESAPFHNAEIAAAFEQLPARLRIVATLALVEERPHAEIADALNLPLGTVKSRLFRAIRTLRKELVRMGIKP